VQLNHPSVSKFFNDADGDRKADGGFENLESFIDAELLTSLTAPFR
jgi:hypothetical protein